MMEKPENRLAGKRIIILLGSFLYDATNSFAKELGKGIAAHGCETIFIDKPSVEDLYGELQKGCAFVVAFNGIGSDISINGENIFNKLNIPLAAVLVDHPAHHIARLCGDIRDMTVFCCDESHKVFLEKYFKLDRRVGMLHHGGAVLPAAETPPVKNINILFPGTYTDEKHYYEPIGKLNPSSRKFTDEVIDIILSKDTVSTEDVFLEHARVSGFDLLENNRLFRGMCPVISFVEFFVRAVKRNKILKLLDDAGVSVDIYGNGWKREMFKCHRIFPPAPFYQMLENMCRSEIVFNMCSVPGSHERVFSSMLNGSVSVSDYNLYLERNFSDGKNIILYKWTQINKLPEILSLLLKNEALKNRILKASYTECIEKHTWRQRAGQFLAFMNEAM